eukprot:SAG31_NODE_48165_length_198_cov_24.060606_1_plen_41_part_10
MAYGGLPDLRILQLYQSKFPGGGVVQQSHLIPGYSSGTSLN